MRPYTQRHPLTRLLYYIAVVLIGYPGLILGDTKAEQKVERIFQDEVAY